METIKEIENKDIKKNEDNTKNTTYSFDYWNKYLKWTKQNL